MKKVAILTLNGNGNYGNKLQNYALEQALIKMGCDVETLWIDIYKNMSILEKVKITYVNIRNKGLRSLKESPDQRVLEKEARFKQFSRKYLHESKEVYSTKKEMLKVEKLFDYFVVGSDQVWNPYFLQNGNKLPLYLLEFAKKGKSLSYAASFGLSDIPEKYQHYFKKTLKNFKAISVREQRGVELVEELANAQATLVLDPTMLLEKSNWEQLYQFEQRLVNHKYVLTYYLGELPTEYQEYINKIAGEHDLEVVNIGKKENLDVYYADPAGFLKLIAECEIFFTDSFHGSVFSILFEKPFVVFKRQGSVGMYTRIETLLKEFQLEERAYETLCKSDDIFKIDYEHVAPVLQKRRQESLDFLRASIE